MEKTDIKSLTLGEMKASIAAMSLPAFRAGQIYKWLHVRGVTGFDEMTDLSKELRASFSQTFEIFGCAIEKKQISEYNNTVKYLFKLNDGELIESVLIRNAEIHSFFEHTVFLKSDNL